MCSVLRTKNKQTKKKKPLQGIFPFARWSICTLQLACRVLCWCFDDEPGVYCSPSSSSSSPGTQTTSTGASGSHLQSAKLPQREAPASSLAHSPPLPQAVLGNVCNGFHPNLGHSVPPRSQQQVSRGRLRWVGFAWQRPAGRPSLFHRARTAARGTTRCACVFGRQGAFLCSTCRE